MPTTAQNITRIKEAVGYSRPQILDVLDELQIIVYSQRTEETLYIDPNTGYPPFLVTQDNVKHYDCPSNCWMTASIFSDEPIRRYRTTADHGESRTYYWQNKSYARIEITQTLKTQDQLATVTFRENPGDTTEKFYHSYWIQPTRLTDESIQLDLPEHVHYVMRKAAIAILQTENYGQTGFDDDIIEQASKKIRKELNRGARGRLGRTPVRQEYLDWNNTDAGLWL